MASIVATSSNPSSLVIYVPEGEKPQYEALREAIKQKKVDDVRAILDNNSTPPLAFEEGRNVKIIVFPSQTQENWDFFAHAFQPCDRASLTMSLCILRKYPLMVQNTSSFNLFIFNCFDLGGMANKKIDVKIQIEVQNLACDIFRAFLQNGAKFDVVRRNITNGKYSTFFHLLLRSRELTSLFLPIIEGYASNFRQLVYKVVKAALEINKNMPVNLQSTIVDYLSVGTVNIDNINRYSGHGCNDYTSLGFALKWNNTAIPFLMRLGANPNLPIRTGIKKTIFEYASPQARTAMLEAVLPEDKEGILAATSLN